MASVVHIRDGMFKLAIVMPGTRYALLALLVIPAATARNLSRNLRQHLIFSVLAGLVGGVGGTLLAYQFDVPCGPMVVLTAIGLFLISLVAGHGRQKSRAI